MSIHFEGKKITAMYWGGQKIREAWYEGRVIWERPTITIDSQHTRSSNYSFIPDSAEGRLKHLLEWTRSGNAVLGKPWRFTAPWPVVCDREVNQDWIGDRRPEDRVPAGTPIPAGKVIHALHAGKHTFTPLED